MKCGLAEEKGLWRILGVSPGVGKGLRAILRVSLGWTRVSWGYKKVGMDKDL